jgi:hypothetical protein
MASISMVKVRAKITIGTLVTETPFIRSFSVNKTRGQISTFNAVLKIPYTRVSSNIRGSNIVIQAGTDGNLKKIFTGMVRQAKISPCFDDPHYVDVSISGSDVLAHLQNKKFTRRCRSTLSSWVAINSVVRRGLKSSKFKQREMPVLEVTDDDPKQAEITKTRPLSGEQLTDPPKGDKRRDIDVWVQSVAEENIG